MIRLICSHGVFLCSRSSLEQRLAAQAEEANARLRVHLDDPKVDFRNLPLRDAQEQLRHGGLESYVVVTDRMTDLVYVAGKDGGSRMLVSEWNLYKTLVEVASRQKPRPSLTELFQRVQDNMAEFVRTARKAQRSNFAQVFDEIEELLRHHEGCIREEERDEMIRQAAARLKPLKEAVLRAEQIWREQSRQQARGCEACGGRGFTRYTVMRAGVCDLKNRYCYCEKGRAMERVKRTPATGGDSS